MAKKNVVFNKDGGVKIGVKNMSEEDYAAKQQKSVKSLATIYHQLIAIISYLVKAWNLSSMPAYKSLFWNKAEQAKQKGSLLAANGDKEAERKLSSANSSRSGSYVTGLSASGSNIGQRHSVSSPGGFPE